MATEVDKENFAISLTDEAKTHDQWLCIVRYGLKTLLEDQQLLIEIIVREADRMRERAGLGHRKTSDDARVIMQELGLKFVTV